MFARACYTPWTILSTHYLIDVVHDKAKGACPGVQDHCDATNKTNSLRCHSRKQIGASFAASRGN